MKAKDVISELNKIDPETDIYIHRFDHYTITNDFIIGIVYRSRQDLGNINCFVKDQDEDFQTPTVIFSTLKSANSIQDLPEYHRRDYDNDHTLCESDYEYDYMNAQLDSQLDDLLL